MSETKEEKPILGRQVVHLTDFDEESDKLEDAYGRTNLYSTSTHDLDEYFRGGYGRKDGYEIVVLFGDTGVGKSTFGMNLLIDPIKKGKRVGLLMLEDDGPDVNAKMRRLLGRDELRKHSRGIHFTPEDVVSGEKLWGLDDLLKLIEEWFTERKMDVIFLDHLQFAFESAVSIKGENEYVSQRIFMRRINYMMRKLGKTIILVSHTNKTAQAKGLAKIVGSSGIAAAATKIIEVSRDEAFMHVRIWKSRFTSTPDHERAFKFDRYQRIIGPNDKVDLSEVPF